jgi:hypothetical protein
MKCLPSKYFQSLSVVSNSENILDTIHQGSGAWFTKAQSSPCVPHCQSVPWYPWRGVSKEGSQKILFKPNIDNDNGVCRIETVLADSEKVENLKNEHTRMHSSVGSN